jgi:hypothetical protein
VLKPKVCANNRKNKVRVDESIGNVNALRIIVFLAASMVGVCYRLAKHTLFTAGSVLSVHS